MHPFGANPQNTCGSIPALMLAKVDFSTGAFPKLLCSPGCYPRRRQKILTTIHLYWGKYGKTCAQLTASNIDNVSSSARVMKSQSILKRSNIKIKIHQTRLTSHTAFSHLYLCIILNLRIQSVSTNLKDLASSET